MRQQRQQRLALALWVIAVLAVLAVVGVAGLACLRLQQPGGALAPPPPSPLTSIPLHGARGAHTALALVPPPLSLPPTSSPWDGACCAHTALVPVPPLPLPPAGPPAPARGAGLRLPHLSAPDPAARLLAVLRGPPAPTWPLALPAAAPAWPLALPAAAPAPRAQPPAVAALPPAGMAAWRNASAAGPLALPAAAPQAVQTRLGQQRLAPAQPHTPAAPPASPVPPNGTQRGAALAAAAPRPAPAPCARAEWLRLAGAFLAGACSAGLACAAAWLRSGGPRWGTCSAARAQLALAKERAAALAALVRARVVAELESELTRIAAAAGEVVRELGVCDERLAVVTRARDELSRLCGHHASVRRSPLCIKESHHLLEICLASLGLCDDAVMRDPDWLRTVVIVEFKCGSNKGLTGVKRHSRLHAEPQAPAEHAGACILSVPVDDCMPVSSLDPAHNTSCRC